MEYVEKEVKEMEEKIKVEVVTRSRICGCPIKARAVESFRRVPQL